MKNGIINELKFSSKKKENVVLGYVYCDYLLNMFEEIERLNNIKEKIRECLYKNKVYIAGERNLAFEIEQILDKGE